METVSGEQKLFAIIAHTAYFLGGVGFIIAPLILMLLKKDDPFVYHHSKQALIAHLAILIVSLVVSILCSLLIGILLIPILAILWISLVITSLIASLRVLDGKLYNYPLIQGFVNKF
ncbi:DUF4870 domain-containing protein [Dendrosporobacter sp. 1207_IL3150]|uniref:DUF4870 domain-containing protein n=1 Tax=Dendrosporobacter sp. 1207_IL3150 TaxID=3084054 RepID=UPI002FDABACA